MRLRIAFPVAAVLAAVPVLALAQAHEGQPAIPEDKPPTTVEGIVVEPKAKPTTLPDKPCDPKDVACMTVVVETLKQRFPEDFKKLSYWCMSKATAEIAGTLDARDRGETITGFGLGDSDPRNASCNVIYREAKKK